LHQSIADEKRSLVDVLHDGSFPHAKLRSDNPPIEMNSEPNKSILVIDDDAQICTLLSHFLRQQGYTVETASDGRQGFIRAAQTKPDLIICDLDMPEMDGQTVVKLLRRNVTLSQTAIIYLSGHTDDATIRQSMNFGGDDFLKKPVLLPEVAAAVRSRLARHEQLQKLSSEQAHEAVRILLGIINDLDKSGEFTHWSNDVGVEKEFDVREFGSRLQASRSTGRPANGSSAADTKLLVKNQNRREIIRLSQVKAILANGEYSEVCWGENCRTLFRKSIRTWVKELPATHFVRIHRSSIINLNFFKHEDRSDDGRRLVHLNGINQPFQVSQRMKAGYNRALKRHPQASA
jgi:CheY-like chemotaxis protein